MIHFFLSLAFILSVLLFISFFHYILFLNLHGSLAPSLRVSSHSSADCLSWSQTSSRAGRSFLAMTHLQLLTRRKTPISLYPVSFLPIPVVSLVWLLLLLLLEECSRTLTIYHFLCHLLFSRTIDPVVDCTRPTLQTLQTGECVATR